MEILQWFGQGGDHWGPWYQFRGTDWRVQSKMWEEDVDKVMDWANLSRPAKREGSEARQRWARLTAVFCSCFWKWEILLHACELIGMKEAKMWWNQRAPTFQLEVPCSTGLGERSAVRSRGQGLVEDQRPVQLLWNARLSPEQHGSRSFSRVDSATPWPTLSTPVF